MLTRIGTGLARGMKSRTQIGTNLTRRSLVEMMQTNSKTAGEMTISATCKDRCHLSYGLGKVEEDGIRSRMFSDVLFKREEKKISDDDYYKRPFVAHDSQYGLESEQLYFNNFFPATWAENDDNEPYISRYEYVIQWPYWLRRSSCKNPDLKPGIFECDSKYLGPLEVDRLPRDAWQNWCKEGVLCFGAHNNEVMKVFFVDPRNLSIYHVIDFDYLKFGRWPHWRSVGCILSGSKIYVIGGRHGSCTGPIDVYFCDVSTPPLLRDNGNSYEWEWQEGPKLNNYKGMPLVFSLMGNIYVLSLSTTVGFTFEVLKSDSCRWEVLSPPHPSLSIEMSTHLTCLKPLFDISGKKMIISCNEFVFTYDAERNEWTRKKLSVQNPFAKLREKVMNFTMHCRGIEEKNGLFDTSEKGTYDMLDFCRQFLQDFSTHFSPTWHLFQLRGSKFCFVAFYYEFSREYDEDDGHEEPKYKAQVGTFDLVECSSDEHDSKHLELGKARYRVTELRTRHIVVKTDGDIWPYIFCSKT